MFGSAFGAHSLGNSTPEGAWIGRSPSSTQRLRRRKRGSGCQENQAGEGLEVHGGGRRRGSSSGNFHHLGLAVGDEAGGADARNDCRSPSGSRSTAQTYAATDCRSRLRFRSPATRSCTSGHRPGLSSPHQPRSTQGSGRTQTSTLLSSLDHRTDDRVVWSFPAPRRALRTIDSTVPGVLPLRVRPDRPQTVMKPVLDTFPRTDQFGWPPTMGPASVGAGPAAGGQSHASNSPS